MALRDERIRLSWGLLTVLLTLVLAGCGGDSGGNSGSTGGTTGSNQADTAHKASLPQEQAESKPEQKSASPDLPEKAVVDEGSGAPPQIAQPGVVIENPIFADPIPVPVPEDARPESGSEDSETGQADDGRTDEAEPEVAKPKPDPEPETEEPDPIAERPTLRWNSPLSREDGSKLYPGEIGGYRVYYRLRHQDEFKSVVIDGPDADSLELDSFEPGAYEFAVTTLDIDGLESRRSDPVKVDLI